MALGLMCQIVQPRIKRDGTTVYENIIDEKLLQLGAYRDGKYTTERIIGTYRHNVKEILRTIPYLVEHSIKSFRLSSTILPLYEFCGELARSDSTIKQDLAEAGRLFQQHGIRVTTHPGQFCVLSSDKQSVIDNSIRELDYHAFLFDAMGFPQTTYYAINVHGGKANRSEKLIEVISSLPDNIRKRLTLENDEKCYNVKSLLDISEHTSVPVVLDSHHYTFGVGDLEFADAFAASMATWGNTKPLQHISNSEVGMENAPYNQKRAHSDLIRYIPDLQLNAIRDDIIDVDVEAKLKNVALLKMRKNFAILN
jgi:UV DNA damage endonuclease